MSKFYPKALANLTISFEDFGNIDPKFRQGYKLQVEPKRAQVLINNYTEADTFELEIDYKTFPFDPRAIRSLSVQIFMEDVEGLYRENRSIDLVASTDNIVFTGFADQETMTLSENRTIRFTGRDFTSIFTDRSWDGDAIDIGKPVNQVIQELVSEIEEAKTIQVANRTNLATLPTLAKVGADLGKLAGKRNSRRKESYWDVIQNLLGQAGLIGYIELDKLVITKPRNLYSEDDQVPRFVYGQNIKDFELVRNLGLQKGFNIEVRAISTSKKELIKVEIPLDAINLPNKGRKVQITKSSSEAENTDPKDAPTIQFLLSGITDRNQLIEVGEKIWEEMGRQQVEGRFTTYEMEVAATSATSPDNFVGCFDLLKLRNGSPIHILITVDDLRQIQKQESEADRVKYLEDRCYPKPIATAFAQTLGKLPSPFYTRAVTFNISADSGLRIDVDFVNYIQTSALSGAV